MRQVQDTNKEIETRKAKAADIRAPMGHLCLGPVSGRHPPFHGYEVSMHVEPGSPREKRDTRATVRSISVEAPGEREPPKSAVWCSPQFSLAAFAAIDSEQLTQASTPMPPGSGPAMTAS